MAFKLNGWSAFTFTDDDKLRKEKLLKLAEEWTSGDAATRDSIANLDYVGGNFPEYYKKEIKKIKSWPKFGEKNDEEKK